VKRRTVQVHGRRCYADTVRVIELSPGGASIVVADNVSPYAQDWDRGTPPMRLEIDACDPPRKGVR
jgi:hypothetical protein